jgi:hypothetical protein
MPPAKDRQLDRRLQVKRYSIGSDRVGIACRGHTDFVSSTRALASHLIRVFRFKTRGTVRLRHCRLPNDMVQLQGDEHNEVCARRPY